ncbi:MAG: hypothetical protein PHS41_00310 [Victivallaceae bacterium]|nr:hypothetical protein [Victivallaceae bacterium]
MTDSHPLPSSILPVGDNPEPLRFPHFPTSFQCVIFRNWNMVAPARLAEVLQCREEIVCAEAKAMGLTKADLQRCEVFAKRGFVTLIRINWELLNYAQLLTLLDWSEEQLNDTLQNDDFLWAKMGHAKPRCEEVFHRELTVEERRRTEEIRRILAPLAAEKHTARPFDFSKYFRREGSRKPIRRDNFFGRKIIYGYPSPYGNVLEESKVDPYPDDLLQSLAACGINAIWVPVVLYKMIPWEEAPSLSAEWSIRMENLRKIIAKAAKFHLKVFVYLNEPRGLPAKCFLGEKKLREKYFGAIEESADKIAFCTSKPAVLPLLADRVERFFRQLPDLGGAFLITRSENLTHCLSREEATECPACRKRALPELLAEINRTIVTAAHRGNPDAKIYCWNWAWAEDVVSTATAEKSRSDGFASNPERIFAGVLDHLPASASVMAVSESGVPVQVGKTRTRVRDYSISHAGPSEVSRLFFQMARKRHLGTAAKVQLSNSWECASVPYIPATFLVAEHLERLREAGVDDLLVSWTLGGYPSPNLELLSLSHRRMVQRRFGNKAAPEITLALQNFSEAFRAFPFSVEVAYRSPHNMGPANLLFGTPTGRMATMVGNPVDDLDSWCGVYSPEEYLSALEKLSHKWHIGLRHLQKAMSAISAGHRKDGEDLASVAEACHLLFSSAARQGRFIQLRNSGKEPGKIIRLLREEQEAARRMLKLVLSDPRIGFEPSNHYMFTANELMEKIINCEFLINSSRRFAVPSGMLDCKCDL